MWPLVPGVCHLVTGEGRRDVEVGTRVSRGKAQRQVKLGQLQFLDGDDFDAAENGQSAAKRACDRPFRDLLEALFGQGHDAVRSLAREV